jgi:hypothetical protein
MTTLPPPPGRLPDVLQVYDDHPLDDGDAVLVLDDRVCLELEQLAAQWDERLRTNTAQVLRSTATRAAVLIARPGGVLRDSDYQLWRDLHAELRGSEVDLLPVRGLRAA